MPDATLPKINPQEQVQVTTAFLKKIFRNAGKQNAVIGWSGGIDSTVSLFLLSLALPKENIHVIHMPYQTSYMDELAPIQEKLHLPTENVRERAIKTIVDTIGREEHIGQSGLDKIRLGNVMARTRMILLFDQARLLNGLVCGTENKTEHLLGYFTRFGDAAADIEPLANLYKTQVYELARFLGVPELFLGKTPSANLWDNQTDEGEFGFTYEEADIVCHLHFDLGEPVEKIERKGFSHAKDIIGFAGKNAFKQAVPYTMK